MFALPTSSFASGKAGLSGGGDSTRRGRSAAYAQASSAGAVKVEATGSDAKLAQRRAEAVRDALVAGGVPAAKVAGLRPQRQE